MNNVSLIGRLCRDPEMRTSISGQNNTVFALAVDKKSKNEAGKYGVDYINCTSWNNIASNISKHCKKGDLVGISGHLQTREYTAFDGNKRYVTEVVIESIKFLSVKKDIRSMEENIEKEEINMEESYLDEEGLPF